MRRFKGLVMMAVMMLPVAGCVVEPAPRPAFRPAPAYACVWVPAHYDVYGKYIPAHCKR